VDGERGTLLVRRGKGNKDRFVPIGPRALAWLDKYLAEVRPKFLADASTQTIFLTRTGKKLRADQLSMTVRQYLVKAGIAKQGACH